ncbi:MAG: RNA polymerase sigma factor, partial [Planctomycetota bacterium]
MSEQGKPTSGSAHVSIDPARMVEEHGDVLYAYALQRLRDREVAEDLVQQTLLAALKSAKTFNATASPRTWLIAILRNKMADHIRKRVREAARVQSLDVENLETAAEGEPSWDDRGCWKGR